MELPTIELTLCLANQGWTSREIASGLQGGTPDNLRLILLLTNQGRSPREIAQALRTSERTVYRRLVDLDRYTGQALASA